jgi:hypothetical protein
MKRLRRLKTVLFAIFNAKLAPVSKITGTEFKSAEKNAEGTSKRLTHERKFKIRLEQNEVSRLNSSSFLKKIFKTKVEIVCL